MGSGSIMVFEDNNGPLPINLNTAIIRLKNSLGIVQK